jgi:hypothetical protein
MTTTTRNQIAVLIMTLLIIAMTVFASTNATTTTASDAQANQKTPPVAMKQMLCGSGGECPN